MKDFDEDEKNQKEKPKKVKSGASWEFVDLFTLFSTEKLVRLHAVIDCRFLLGLQSQKVEIKPPTTFNVEFKPKCPTLKTFFIFRSLPFPTFEKYFRRVFHDFHDSMFY